MNYVIAYDIKDDKRRKKLVDILEGYGVRVNYSVFEFYLSKQELTEIVNEIKKIVNSKDDSVRIYRVCESCARESFEICKKDDVFSFNYG